MNKTQVSATLAAIYLGASSLVFAADMTTTTKEPLSQSITSVEKNLTRDADSKGLNNALNRLETNQDRLETKKAAKLEKRIDKIKRAEKTEKVEEAERVEHVEKAERAEKAEKVEKVERVEKIEKVEKAEKMQRPEKVERVASGR